MLQTDRHDEANSRCNFANTLKTKLCEMHSCKVNTKYAFLYFKRRSGTFLRYLYQTTRRHVLENVYLHSHRCQTIESRTEAYQLHGYNVSFTPNCYLKRYKGKGHPMTCYAGTEGSKRRRWSSRKA